jgi:hypothetical protein
VLHVNQDIINVRITSAVRLDGRAVIRRKDVVRLRLRGVEVPQEGRVGGVRDVSILDDMGGWVGLISG